MTLLITTLLFIGMFWLQQEGPPMHAHARKGLNMDKKCLRCLAVHILCLTDKTFDFTHTDAILPAANAALLLETSPLLWSWLEEPAPFV
ncbi:hypothetical protein DFH09DRAFT_1333638 [Mycena vulgaris]|nr:hypothetical protein DFH09DRAFT_1333638 [Mycena vulgaris]